jgi:hypothetical protein
LVYLQTNLLRSIYWFAHGVRNSLDDFGKHPAILEIGDCGELFLEASKKISCVIAPCSVQTAEYLYLTRGFRFFPCPSAGSPTKEISSGLVIPNRTIIDSQQRRTWKRLHVSVSNSMSIQLYREMPGEINIVVDATS